eukprot:jgi/Tetstr1/457729/TSEL_044275.t1
MGHLPGRPRHGGDKLCAAPAPRDLCSGGHAVAFARTSRGEEQGHGKADWRSNNKIAGQLLTLAREYASLGGDTADGDRFRCLAKVGPAYQRQIKERLVLAGHDGAAGTLNRLATAAAAAGAPGPVFMAAGARALAVLVPAGVGRRLMEHARFPDTEAAIADYIAADVACSLGHQFYTARHQVTVRVVHQIASGLLPRTSRERALFRAAAAAGRFTHVMYVGRISPVAHNRRLQTEWHADNEQRSPHLQTEFCEAMLGEGLAPTLRDSDRIAFLDNIGTSVGAADGAAPAALAEIQRRVAALRAGHTLLVATTGMDRLTRDPRCVLNLHRLATDADADPAVVDALVARLCDGAPPGYAPSAAARALAEAEALWQAGARGGASG